MENMFKLLLGILAVMGGYIYGDKTKEGTRVILGGEWFRETETGEQNGYLMVEFKNKVFDPLMERVAKHIYENTASLSKLAWMTR